MPMGSIWWPVKTVRVLDYSVRLSWKAMTDSLPVGTWPHFLLFSVNLIEHARLYLTHWFIMNVWPQVKWCLQRFWWHLNLAVLLRCTRSKSQNVMKCTTGTVRGAAQCPSTELCMTPGLDSHQTFLENRYVITDWMSILMIIVLIQSQ